MATAAVPALAQRPHRPGVHAGHTGRPLTGRPSVRSADLLPTRPRPTCSPIRCATPRCSDARGSNPSWLSAGSSPPSSTGWRPRLGPWRRDSEPPPLGRLAWLLTLQFFVVEAIAQALRGPYSRADDVISDSGADSAAAADERLVRRQAALILAGAAAPAGPARRGRSRRCCWAASAVGVLLVGVFPSDGNALVHAIGAVALPGRRRARADRPRLRGPPPVGGPRARRWRSWACSARPRRCSS